VSHDVQPPERVLSTLNADGTRRWIRPKPSPGGFWRKRRVTAYALMVVFFLIPYLRIGGKPLILLDIPRRQFTLFGTTFLPTDTLLFMLLLISLAMTVLLVTALLGRVWCGWACPQTVYLEFLFRPLERWLEGGRGGSLAIDKAGGWRPKRLLTWAVYGVLSLLLAHTFLAYFVGVEQLALWVRSSPAEHPTAFFIMALTAGAVFFDFAYFREQTCLVACPYGRLQSVLLDRQSLIVGYDARRGEPRALPGRNRPAAAGDCVDCGACVQTCPTGIDIRDGLQMECIHCTQCMDACDAVMDHVGKPRGLVRYSSREGLEGKPARVLRPRVVLYPAALLVVLGLFGWFLGHRQDTDVTLLRGLGAPYTLAGETVVNQVRVRIANHAATARDFRIELIGEPAATMIAPENPLRVAAGAMRSTSVFVTLPRTTFHEGEWYVLFRLSDGRGYRADQMYELVGPEHDTHERAEDRPAGSNPAGREGPDR
jgi:cytochrome c oxidase accessory protein FixG